MPQSCGYVPRPATSWECIRPSQDPDPVYMTTFSNLLCWALAAFILRFSEFESAEEMENARLEMEASRLEIMRSVQCQFLATTARQDPPRPPAPEVFEEPGRGHVALGLYAEVRSVKIDFCSTCRFLPSEWDICYVAWGPLQPLVLNWVIIELVMITAPLGPRLPKDPNPV